MATNKQIRRILVTIKDPRHPPRALLRKATTLARASGAALELFHSIVDREVAQRVRGAEARETAKEAMDSIGATATRQLERLARAMSASGVRVTVRPSWDYPPNEAIIRRALETHADLVIAAVQPHHLGGRLLLANTDWELIRHCPVPVLLVKSSGDYASPALIAAVDPFHAHAKPADLDRRILAIGDTFSRVLKGMLHVFHAYMPLTVVASGSGSALAIELPPEFEDMHAARVESALNELAKQAGIPPARRHLHMGQVSDELRAVAKRTHARIIVLGAVSRSALRRAFIGNTAESVLDALNCDVLVVKPRGFESGVPRRPLRDAGSR